ncbi:sorbosone dehydrogenase family protein [Sphingomonas koreensis]|nr:sorbosone dehydrogenase family protein [Sphingomonas koreensis]
MIKHIVRVTSVVVVLAVVVLVWLGRPDKARLSLADVTGALPQITPPRNQIIPTMDVAKGTGWPAGQKPTAAAGLQVAAFAAGLDHPRWLYVLPNGDVLVAETNAPPSSGGGITGFVARHLMNKGGAGVPSANRITLLRDANHDGVAESRSVLIARLNSPFGMALMGGYLYIGDTDAVVRVPFTPGQTRITAKPEKIVDLPHGGLHWARNVIAAPDGQSLFVTVGASTNIADNGMDAEDHRADILQVNPATKTERIYAAGMRNPNGLAIDPQSGRLWAAVNERDMMGSDVAPDYISAVELGDHFGWPWYYWGGYPDKRVDPPNPALQQYAKRPDYAMGPHVAALGLAFSQGSNLGPRFADGVFVGEHGSWNRKPPSGYKVVYVPFAPTGFPAPGVKPIDILTGFLSADGDMAYGRPVGVTVGPGGGLLVADDVGNTVWRVSAASSR